MPKLDLDSKHLEAVNPDNPTTAYKVSSSQVHEPVKQESPPLNLSFLSPPLGPDELGRLGSYRLTKLLGSGGMGLVFEAEDTLLRRQVALKVMKPEIAANPTHRQRFLQEARSGASIPHDNIVTVYQVGMENNIPFLAMQYLQGESLAMRLNRAGKIPVPEALRITREVALGLGAAHEGRLIHRDIKSDNIWLEVDSPSQPWKRVKILDFGLARSVSGVDHQTGTGLIMGTPSYMAPEQARGLPLDGRCDLFSLGCVLYQILSGVLPFRGDNTLSILSSLALDEPTPLDHLDSAIPHGVAKLVKDLLAKKPSERVPNSLALLERLQDPNLEKAGPRPSSQHDIPREPAQESAAKSAQAPVPTSSAKPWFLNWKFLGLLLVVFVNLGLLIFNFSSLGINPTGLAGLKEAEPVKVGVLHSTTGYMRYAGKGVKETTLLAIEELNERGGILDYNEQGQPVARRKIVPVIADGLSNPTEFALQAEQLLERHKVAAVFGCWTSADRKQCLKIFSEKKGLLFYPVLYEGLEQNPHVVYLGAAPNQQIEFAFKHLILKEKKAKFFHVGQNSVFSRAAMEIFREQIVDLKKDNPALQAEILQEKLISTGNAKFEEIAKAIKTAKPELIINTLSGDFNRDFFKALRAEGIKGSEIPTLSFHVGGEDLLEQDPSGTIGDYVGWNYLQSIESPENTQFLNKVKAKMGQDVLVTDDMEAGYYGVFLWSQAVREARSVSPVKVAEKIRGQTFQAPGGPVEIDKDTQHTYKIPRIGRIKGPAQFEIFQGNDGKPERPIPFPRYRSEESWNKFLSGLLTEWNGNWLAPAAP